MVCVEFCLFGNIGKREAQRWPKWPFSEVIKIAEPDGIRPPTRRVSVRAFEPHLRRRGVVAPAEGSIEVGEIAESAVECD